MRIFHRAVAYSREIWIIAITACVKFALQVYIAPGYGYFGDELYTIALSRHLAFGYVDLPPLVPALMAVSRAILGESLLAFHVVPALAGAVKLIFICLITREFGGRWFAVLISAITVISIPVWLSLDSIFCYDSIDQLVLAIFLYLTVRFLKSGEKKYWLWLGLTAGVACMTKMTLLFLGPGFLAALLLSQYRRHLLTPWPYLGAAICLLVVSPYIIWQIANHWPTLEYWVNYGTLRMYQVSFSQFLINIWIYMNPFLLPLWFIGLVRLFRRFKGHDFSFFGVLFLATLILLYFLHSTPRLIIELFIPLIAASSIALETLLTGNLSRYVIRPLVIAGIMAAGLAMMPSSLPILPADRLPEITRSSKYWFGQMREMVGGNSNSPQLLVGRQGWDVLVQEVAGVYNSLSEADRRIAGIYADSYMFAGAIDLYGPQYGLPHAVSESLTYYLWGPGYSWDVMLIVTRRSNNLAVFFNECELKATVKGDYDPAFFGNPNIYLCRKPGVPAEKIWGSLKNYR